MICLPSLRKVDKNDIVVQVCSSRPVCNSLSREEVPYVQKTFNPRLMFAWIISSILWDQLLTEN